MASTKAANITTIDKTDGTKVSAASVRGKQRVYMDTVNIGTASDFNADGDYIVMAQVPSNAKIQSITLYNDSMDSGTDSSVDVGIRSGQVPFTVSGTSYSKDEQINQNAYANGLTTLQSANTSGAEVAFDNRDIKNINNHVWEDAGLSDDPGVYLRIELHQTASVSGAQTGDVSIVVTYAVD